MAVGQTAAMQSAPAVRSRRRGVFSKENLWFLAFLGPNLILLSLFTYWPLLRNAWLSAYRWDLISAYRPFVGWDNYEYVFTSPEAATIFRNTLVFTAGTVGGTMALGLAVALLLNQRLKGRSVARSILFAPYVVSGVAIAIIWLFVFDPNFGLLQQVLGEFGVQSPNWFRDPTWAMPAVIIVYIWKNLGCAVVIYLAGLQAVPEDLHEAAKVDGAGALHRFWHVTLPHLSPVLFFIFVTSILSSLQAFDIINVMTRGGPVNSTTTLIYRMYEEGFVALNAGRAAAYAVVLFAIMLAAKVLQHRFLERTVHYS
jgi:sn-glycerol 3-phosphate transport system permease protein